MNPPGESPSRILLLVAAMATACAASLGAQYQTLGPNRCTGCHDHDVQRVWWETKDGPPPHGHIRALDQLKDPKSRRFLKAVGQTDAYDSNGKCVPCHGTVFRGGANAGVSCERCHGPSSGYLDVHQAKNSRDRSVAVGLYDTIGKPQNWSRLCMSCHLVTDRRLVKANHPSGERFDLAVKVRPVVHWRSVYDSQAIGALGRAARATILGGATGASLPPVAAVPAAPAPATGWTTADSRAAAVVAAEERALRFLSELVRRGGCDSAVADSPAGRPPADRQLDRIQAAVEALALEALTCPPPPQSPLAKP
jgi:hypothetical protein